VSKGVVVNGFSGRPGLEALLVALQAFQVAFLWCHDWVPLGSLNDVLAVRRQDSLARLVIVTLVQSVPYTIGLAWSFVVLGRGYPVELRIWLWVSYGLLFAGQIRAWWIPYLIRPEPERALRYQQMFGKTHRFLPERNGLVPNTLHILLHAATLATLITLFASAR